MISLILAAGKGTRMKSERSKVVHEVNGVPMVKMVSKLLKNAGIEKSIYILGHRMEEVLNTIGEVEYVEQVEQLGTGHAVLMAKEKIEENKDDVLITYGDTPLLREETINRMKEKFHNENLDCIILSCNMKDPFAYGRIIKKDGNVVDIIEEKEATEEQKKIKEVNTGVYIFKYKSLLEALGKINNNNIKGEYYLTDTIKILSEGGYKVGSYQIDDEDEVTKVEKAQEALNYLNSQIIDDKNFQKAIKLINEEKIEEALKLIQKFLEDNPKRWNGWFLLGWALRKAKRWTDGVVAFKKCIELYKQTSTNCLSSLTNEYSEMCNEQAICLIESGNIKEAEEVLKEALILDCENVKLISNLGIVALKTGDKQKAIAYFRTVLFLSPHDEVALNMLKFLES